MKLSWGLLIVLLLLRFYDLDARPPHHDEAVNGWFVDGIFRQGYYHYDPQNYHGPLFFYFLTLFEVIFGRSIEALRAVTVVIGSIFSLSPFFFRKWIGERTAWIASLALVLSPASVFYSRYAIHEMVFSLSLVVFFFYWWRARTEGFSLKLAVVLGLVLASMMSLKETFFIFLGCLGIAEGFVYYLQKLQGERGVLTHFFDQLPMKERFVRIGIMLVICFFGVAVLYTGGFRDLDGVPNFFRAFDFWSQTGNKGNGHAKPVTYWFSLLFQFEWPAFVGLVLSPLALFPQSRTGMSSSLRLLVVMTGGHFLAYSIIPYKTPWCLLCFYWGFAIGFGFWVDRIWTRVLPRIQMIPNLAVKGLCVGLLLVGGGISAFQAIDVSYINVDSDTHPYIYGQTYRDFMVPIAPILEKGRNNPAWRSKAKVQVISEFTWPLPWVLGEFTGTGYYSQTNAPAILDAEILFIDTKLLPSLEARIIGNYDRSQVRSRQWASTMTVLVRGNLLGL